MLTAGHKSRQIHDFRALAHYVEINFAFRKSVKQRTRMGVDRSDGITSQMHGLGSLPQNRKSGKSSTNRPAIRDGAASHSASNAGPNPCSAAARTASALLN